MNFPLYKYGIWPNGPELLTEEDRQCLTFIDNFTDQEWLRHLITDAFNIVPVPENGGCRGLVGYPGPTTHTYPLDFALNGDNKELLDWCVKLHYNFNREPRAMNNSCTEGRLDKIKFLLDHGYVLTSNNIRDPLETIFRLGHTDIIDFIFEYVDINNINISDEVYDFCMMKSLCNPYVIDLIMKIINRGHKPSQHILYNAFIWGNIDLMSILYNYGTTFTDEFIDRYAYSIFAVNIDVLRHAVNLGFKLDFFVRDMTALEILIESKRHQSIENIKPFVDLFLEQKCNMTLTPYVNETNMAKANLINGKYDEVRNYIELYLK